MALTGIILCRSCFHPKEAKWEAQLHPVGVEAAWNAFSRAGSWESCGSCGPACAAETLLAQSMCSLGQVRLSLQAGFQVAHCLLKAETGAKGSSGLRNALQPGPKGKKTTLVSLTDTAGSSCGTKWIQVPAQSCFSSSCCLQGSRFWYPQNITPVALSCCLSHSASTSSEM